jgi:hypothetical protein
MSLVHENRAVGPVLMFRSTVRGRTISAMRVPYPHDGSAYGQIVIPVIVLAGRNFPVPQGSPSGHLVFDEP